MSNERQKMLTEIKSFRKNVEELSYDELDILMNGIADADHALRHEFTTMQNEMHLNQYKMQIIREAMSKFESVYEEDDD